MEFIYEPERIYMKNEDGKVVAEVTFPENNGIANINQTKVDGSLRGQGIAGKLVKAAADQIVKDGNGITATCSYAVEWFSKHPEYKFN